MKMFIDFPTAVISRLKFLLGMIGVISVISFFSRSKKGIFGKFTTNIFQIFLCLIFKCEVDTLRKVVLGLGILRILMCKISI